MEREFYKSLTQEEKVFFDECAMRAMQAYINYNGLGVFDYTSEQVFKQAQSMINQRRKYTEDGRF